MYQKIKIGFLNQKATKNKTFEIRSNKKEKHLLSYDTGQVNTTVLSTRQPHQLKVSLNCE